MLYCIEVNRDGICEESMVLHENFEAEPTREDILKIILDEDCGYVEYFCYFEYYRVD